MNFGKVDYDSNIVPKKYKCTSCGIHGCKLWREYQTFLNHQTLSCIDCAAKSQNKDINIINNREKPDEFGRYQNYEIGWRVLAVPTEEGDTYWGYSSVPSKGINWWRSLPSRMP